MPETMQMAELFGWKKGAFTGAHSDREGLLGAAEGGTLFLDEIDKLSLGAQAGLLRVLETRRFSPLGGSRERQADVRFVVATNANLVELVHRGEFREDLYYRINVLPVVLDALDQRADEIVAWAQFFTERRHQEAGGEGAVVLDDGARALLTGRSWPGNLRQLDNVMRRSYALWLADRGTGDVLIEAPLLERALGLEMSRAAHPRLAMDLIGRAAELLVEHALTLRRHGDTARLETYDVLRAAVVRAAVDRVGSAKDAFLLFGETARVESRNHARDYKKLLEDIEALEALLARRRS
jgi:DNA-binding NtrC family response regulator